MFNRYRYSSTTLNPKLQPYYDALKSVISDTYYPTTTLRFRDRLLERGAGYIQGSSTIGKNVWNSERWKPTLEDVSSDTDIAFTGRLIIDNEKAYEQFEEKVKKKQSEEIAKGLNVVIDDGEEKEVEYVYHSPSNVRSIVSWGLEQVEASFNKAARKVNLPKFSELFNLRIFRYTGDLDYRITLSISKEEALKALASQPKLLELEKEIPAVKKAPTESDLTPYYNALKDVIGDTQYKSVTFTNTGSDKLKGITTYETTHAISKKHPNSDAVIQLKNVNTDTHFAFSGRLHISPIQKYIDLENWTKDNEAEEKALGLKVTYTYPGLNKAKNIIQQAVENAKAAFINSASHVNLPKFLELFNIEIIPNINSHLITVSISKEEALKALASQPTSFEPVPPVNIAPAVKSPIENKLLELKQPTSRRRPQPTYEDKLKKAPKPEAFQPVTPKTRAVKKAPVVKSLPVKTPPVKKSPTIKNPPIKLSIAELNIEKELALLSSYMDFNNLSPSDVNEIVIALKPLTDKVIRNDQFAVYDKKLTPSTDKSNFLSPRLVAKIILLFKQLNKFYDLSDLEPIELVEVISQILPVFNKLPAFKISPKKASFYRSLF